MSLTFYSKGSGKLQQLSWEYTISSVSLIQMPKTTKATGVTERLQVVLPFLCSQVPWIMLLWAVLPILLGNAIFFNWFFAGACKSVHLERLSDSKEKLRKQRKFEKLQGKKIEKYFSLDKSKRRDFTFIFILAMIWSIYFTSHYDKSTFV